MVSFTGSETADNIKNTPLGIAFEELLTDELMQSYVIKPCGMITCQAERPFTASIRPVPEGQTCIMLVEYNERFDH